MLEESTKVITKEVEFEVDTTFVRPTTGKEGPQINTIIQFQSLYGSGQGELNHVNTTIKLTFMGPSYLKEYHHRDSNSVWLRAKYNMH